VSLLRTSQIVAQTALNLAKAGASVDEASQEIRGRSDGKRVSVVIALQQLTHGIGDGGPVRARAVEYLEALLEDWKE
jgi:hypothetical protein